MPSLEFRNAMLDDLPALVEIFNFYVAKSIGFGGIWPYSTASVRALISGRHADVRK